jgi:hypothetical protein
MFWDRRGWGCYSIEPGISGLPRNVLKALNAFLLFSIWQLVSRRTNGIGFVIACVVYVLLILSPVLLQCYNRIRVYEAIRRMKRKQVPL